MRRPLNLTDLPLELISRILSFLRDADLVNCTILAKNFRNIIHYSSHLQYKIELAKYRMICLLPQSSAVSYASRLKILRDREHAWKTLTWKARHRLTLPPAGSVYEFAGGLYGNGKEDDQGITSSISFLELPLRDESDPDLRMWSHPTLDVTIVDFTMDPSQDLLILIALAPRSSGYMYELHLRSLTTNEGHPKAPLNKLLCLARPTSNSAERVAALRVQVLGELIALLVKEVHDDEGAHLEIWDWINKPQVSCKMKRTTGIDDFTFLSRDTFLLVRPFGELEVYTYDHPISEETIPNCQITYGFPQLSSSYRYWYITMSSNPTPGSIPPWLPDASYAYGKEKEIHYPNPDERIHACCLYVFDGNANHRHHEHRIHCFVFFVNIRSLLRPPNEWLEEKLSRRKPRKSKKNGYRHLDAKDTSQSDHHQILGSPSVDSGDSAIHRPSTPSIAEHDCHPENSYSRVAPPDDPLSPSSTQSSNSSQGISLDNTRSLPPAIPRVRVPWSVWGPQSTRWFPECLNTDWQHSIYGLRTIEIVTPEKLLFPHTHPPTLLPVHFHDLFEDMTPHSDDSSTEGEDVETKNAPTFSPYASPTELTGPEPSLTLEETEPSAEPDSLAAADVEGESAVRWRYLRLRDYNPYSVKEQLREEEERSEVIDDSKGKGKVGWNESRVVMEPSTLNARGVFKQNVTSRLPYVEVVSEERFDVTDVMMDESRLLLLKRHNSGALKKVEVLAM